MQGSDPLLREGLRHHRPLRLLTGKLPRPSVALFPSFPLQLRRSVVKEAIKVLQPLLLWKIVHFFENYEPGDQRGLILAYAHAAALSLSALGLAVLQHLYYYTVLRLGMKMRVALCHMIYRKVGPAPSSRPPGPVPRVTRTLLSAGSGAQQRSHGPHHHRTNRQPPGQRRQSFR